MLWVAPRRGAPTKLPRTGGSLEGFRVKPLTRDSSSSRSPFEARNAVSCFPKDKMGLETRVSTFPENKMELETPFLASRKTKWSRKRAFLPSLRVKWSRKRRFLLKKGSKNAFDARFFLHGEQKEARNGVSSSQKGKKEPSTRVSCFTENEMGLETPFPAFSRKRTKLPTAAILQVRHTTHPSQGVFYSILQRPSSHET